MMIRTVLAAVMVAASGCVDRPEPIQHSGEPVDLGTASAGEVRSMEVLLPDALASRVDAVDVSAPWMDVSLDGPAVQVHAKYLNQGGPWIERVALFADDVPIGWIEVHGQVRPALKLLAVADSLGGIRNADLPLTIVLPIEIGDMHPASDLVARVRSLGNAVECVGTISRPGVAEVELRITPRAPLGAWRAVVSLFTPDGVLVGTVPLAVTVLDPDCRPLSLGPLAFGWVRPGAQKSVSLEVPLEMGPVELLERTVEGLVWTPTPTGGQASLSVPVAASGGSERGSLLVKTGDGRTWSVAVTAQIDTRSPLAPDSPLVRRAAACLDAGDEAAAIELLLRQDSSQRWLDPESPFLWSEARFLQALHADGAVIRDRLWADGEVVADLLSLLMPRISDAGAPPRCEQRVSAAEAFLSSLPPADVLTRYAAAYVKAYSDRAAEYRRHLSRESLSP